MPFRTIIILLLFTENLFGQCGSEYPSGFYHNPQFINSKGDTLNKLNSSELFEGLHYYTDNPDNLYSDTNSFITGYFQNGLPIGEWKDHCKDGSFSIGQFSVGSGISYSDRNGVWISKLEGIYEKIGIWKYFDKDSNLIETKKYDGKKYKNGWTHKTFKADSSGNFILIKFESAFNYSNWRSKEITKLYSDNGQLIKEEYESLWKEVSYEYYPNGKVKKENRERKFLGINLGSTIKKEYNLKGQTTSKTKTKHKNPKRRPHHDYF